MYVRQRFGLTSSALNITFFYAELWHLKFWIKLVRQNIMPYNLGIDLRDLSFSFYPHNLCYPLCLSDCVVFVFFLLQLWFPLFSVLHHSHSADIAKYEESTIERHVPNNMYTF